MRNILVNTFARLRKDEKGVTLVEYGIAIILAIVVGGGALATLAGDINGQMGTASGLMGTAPGGAAPSTGTGG